MPLCRDLGPGSSESELGSRDGWRECHNFGSAAWRVDCCAAVGRRRNLPAEINYLRRRETQVRFLPDPLVLVLFFQQGEMIVRRDKRNRRGLADLVLFFAVFGAFVFGSGVGTWIDENIGNPFEEAAEWVTGGVTPLKVE